MKNFFVVSVSFAVLLGSAQAGAQALTERQKLNDFSQIMSVVESGYGPLHYKDKKMGISLDRMRAKYEPLVRQTKTNGEFYYLLRRLVVEFQDGHFGLTLPTDHVAQIPIETDYVEDMVLIDTVDRKQLPVEKFPFERGDEIMSIDGVPMRVILDELQSYQGSGYSKTSRRRAAMIVFYRAGAVVPVPTGTAKIVIRRGTSKVLETVSLDWKISGTPLDEVPTPEGDHRFSAPFFLADFNRNMLFTGDDWTAHVGKERAEKSFRCSGNTRIAIPSDATIIMKDPFVAYYHKTPKGNIGYLRIPHYYPVAADGKTFEYEKRYSQYLYAIRILEKNTVGLIIDQDHNCGGSVDYLENMVGLFMSKPYKPMQFQLRANKEEYLDWKKYAEAAAPHTDARKGAELVRDLIRKSWEAGDYLTPTTSINGIEWLQPSPYAYTKPIVMLIDEISGSGGDAFPALMQGYGRATLLGTRTSGLGGHVNELPPLNNSQIAIRMTKSLFFRPDGVEVENNGAVPDVPYSITRDDFMYGYKGYQEFYLKTLLSKLP